MAATTTNWIYNRSAVSDKDTRALEKAKEQELERKRKGWRWIHIENTTANVFVPCKKGKPTEHGQQMIERYKEMLRIK